ncbi:ATP-binding cassette domain-containing protein [Actinotignum urinale]|uniref:ABC transporter ATP-binding protein n=1 Tax=Actinotignum urinale TaxID=190146 RepID=UPI000C808337|nr:ATP-binding cassette domain-containing protein [Actinotignum urinale]WIK58501.1 ATP-binding cassette domain-containing protein [Actinotignum urinale]
MLAVHNLTKRYKKVTAVDDLSFAIEPGRVTGFLGPNGSGKSTTMRCILGLDNPTSGSTSIYGRLYKDLPSPLTTVGALLDQKAFHPKRTPLQHLQILATLYGFPKKRVDEVLEMTGITSVAKKRIGGFSLGMSQRLGIATALLGDPKVLLFDEPVNGLDPEGVRWVRELCQHLASDGRTVFISSHLMSEMAQTAQDIVIIGKGRLIAQGPISDFVNAEQNTLVQLMSPKVSETEELLTSSGFTYTAQRSDSDPYPTFIIRSNDAPALGQLMFNRNLPIYHLSTTHRSLEDIFMSFTSSAVDYRSGIKTTEPGYQPLAPSNTNPFPPQGGQA